MSLLDPRHRLFQLTKQEPVDPSFICPSCSGTCGCSTAWIRQCYRENDRKSTMVLFSATSDTPLAALSFVPTNQHTNDGLECRSMLVERPDSNGADGRNTGRRFQGMMNLPNQEFGITLFNLHYSDFLQFDIFYHKPRSWWWPFHPLSLGRVNYINALPPGQSSRMDADFQHGNCKMVLSTWDESSSNLNLDDPPLTVETAEATGKENVCFDIVATPEKGTKLAELFAEGPAEWRVASSFVRIAPLVCSVEQWKSKLSESKQERFDSPLRRRLRSRKQKREKKKKQPYGTTTTIKVDCGDPDKKDAKKDGKHERRSNHATGPWDVGSTLASSIRHGETVPLGYRRIRMRFDRKCPTEPTMLGLSVWPEMVGAYYVPHTVNCD